MFCNEVLKLLFFARSFLQFCTFLCIKCVPTFSKPPCTVVFMYPQLTEVRERRLPPPLLYNPYFSGCRFYGLVLGPLINQFQLGYQ